MQKFEVNEHVSSLLPDGRWKLVWQDEFDGTELDQSKWDYRLCMMQKRHPAWENDGVTLDGNSNAVFRIYEKDGRICSSQLQTGYNFMDEPSEGASPKEWNDPCLHWPIGNLKENKFLHGFGYYECRCRLQKHPGWWSAFWLQSPIIGSSLRPEISGLENDIMESFNPGFVTPHVNHYNGYGNDHRSVSAGKGIHLDPDAFHVFGMLWDETGYTFYVDGKEDGHIDGPISQTQNFILISTEVNGYRKNGLHTPESEAAAAANDTFLVDYVRVFDRI